MNRIGQLFHTRDPVTPFYPMVIHEQPLTPSQALSDLPECRSFKLVSDKDGHRESPCRVYVGRAWVPGPERRGNEVVSLKLEAAN